MPDAPILDPRGMTLVSRLELVARHAVEGFLAGRHPSPYHGASVEYAEHRPYTLGDEIRNIDWKVLAKTDKTYIKLFEDQTNVRATILLDCSGSMSTGESEGDKLTKYQYGCRIAAALSYLLLGQNDAVGLAIYDRGVRTYLPARGTGSHFRLMLNHMAQARPGGESDLTAVLADLAPRLKRRGLIILISDLLDEPQRFAKGLGRLVFDRHDVLCFQVLDEAELTFPFDGPVRFRDPETGAQTVANPRHARKLYLDQLHQYLDTCRRVCLERNISYEQVSTKTPYDRMLSACLEKRRMLTR